MPSTVQSRLGRAPGSGAKEPCDEGSRGNTALAHTGLYVLNAYQLVSGDRVLDTDNLDATLRGPWVVDAGPWYRPADWNADDDVISGTLIAIPDTIYQVRFTGSHVIGSTAYTFVETLGTEIVADANEALALTIIAKNTAVLAADTATDKAGIAIDAATAAQSSETNAAISESNAEADRLLADAAAAQAISARDAALLSRGLWPTTAAGIGNGVASLASLVAGSGGTNGTFAIGFSGGTQVLAPQGYFVVAGGAIVQAVITYAGYYSAGTPTISFAASAGLTGASATAVVQPNGPLNSYFSTPVAGSNDSLILYHVDAGPVATEITRYQSTALVNASAEVYAYGGQVLAVLKDASDRTIATWLLDAVLRGKLGLVSGDASTQFSYSPSTGLTTLTLPVLVAGADKYVGTEKVILPLTDNADRVLAAGLESGWFYVPKLRVGQIDGGIVAASGGGFFYRVSTVSGQQQIVREQRSSGVRAQITSSGNNSAPSVDAEGVNVIYLSDRAGTPAYYYQPVGGGAEFPVEASSLLVAWGNSLSTPGYYSTYIARSISVQGKSGERDDEIAARMDAVPLSAVVSGNSIPASGSVTVSAFSPNIWRAGMASQSSFRGTLTASNGTVVPGTFTYNAGALAFVRATAGSVLATPNPAVAHITSGYIGGSLDASAAPSLDSLLSSTAILYPDYNSITQMLAAGFTQTDMVNRTLAMVARLTPLVKRWIFVGDWAGEFRLTAAQSALGGAPTEAASKQMIDTTFAITAAIKALYPSNVFDAHAAMVARGYFNNFTVQGSNYQIISSTVLPDGTHPNTLGSQSQATDLNTFLNALGF